MELPHNFSSLRSCSPSFHVRECKNDFVMVITEFSSSTSEVKAQLAKETFSFGLGSIKDIRSSDFDAFGRGFGWLLRLQVDEVCLHLSNLLLELFNGG